MRTGDNQQAKQDNSWLCGMGRIWCHAILCMDVVDSRRCTVHGVHQNISAESSAQDIEQWSTRAEGQGYGPIWCRSSVSWLVIHESMASPLPPSRTPERSASAVCVVASTLLLILGQR